MAANKPTDKELEILQLLWKNGPSTVREVNDELNKHSEVGYTTTLKILQIMHDKKAMVSRSRSGKTHIYTAMASQEATQNQLLDKLIDNAFQGSAMSLVMQALGNRKSSNEDLKEIREFLDKLEGDK